jgi:hypothetical protein
MIDLAFHAIGGIAAGAIIGVSIARRDRWFLAAGVLLLLGVAL